MSRPRARWLGAFIAVSVALALSALATGCGGGGARATQRTAGAAKVKRDPVKPAAAREFEAGLRALRLGGAEAPETAKARFQEALRLDPTLWEAWHDLGVLAYQDGDDEEAIRAFGKALEQNAGDVQSRLGRAEAHRRAGHDKDARDDYELVNGALDDDDPLRRDVAARLASLLRDQKQYDDAIEVLRTTLRVAGANARIYAELGQIYIGQDRLELAQLVLAKALELDAKDPGVYNALAILALRQGKAQEAFERFDRAVSLDADYVDARLNKAAVLLDAGDYARAKVELSAALERRPDDLAAQVSLGVALRGLKDFAQARKVWEKVVKGSPRRDPSHADALFNLAILKADFLEDIPGAKADLDQYMQDASSSHAKRQAAAEKRKELGK
ncbi:MAG: tetratricopeptide repeat protein [Kofleriaceae bacterium]